MVTQPLALSDLLPGDLLFSHTGGNHLAVLLRDALGIPFSHVGLYYGKANFDGGSAEVSIDASPREKKGEGVFLRPLRGLIDPSCSIDDALAWSGVDEVAVLRHPTIAALVEEGKQEQRIEELGGLLCKAANWMTKYARHLLPMLKEIDDPKEANYRFQHLADVLTASTVTASGARLALDESEELTRLTGALTSGYTCSAFVANTFIAARKELKEPELAIHLGLPVGGVLKQHYTVTTVPAVARQQEDISIYFPDPEGGEQRLTDAERKAYRELLWCLSQTLAKKLPKPERRVITDILARPTDGKPAKLERVVYAELDTKVPRFLVGVHHLYRAKGFVEVGRLVRAAPDPAAAAG